MKNKIRKNQEFRIQELFIIIKNNDPQNALNYFNDYKIKNIDATDSWGNSLVACSINHACYELAQKLLEQGANPNTSNMYGRTPLKLLCEDGNLEMIKLLKQYNVDFHPKNSSDLTAFVTAVIYKRQDIIEYILDHESSLQEKKLCFDELALFLQKNLRHTYPGLHDIEWFNQILEKKAKYELLVFLDNNLPVNIHKNNNQKI